MTSFRRSLVVSAAALSMIALAAVTSLALPAAFRAAPPASPVIATVDLEELIAKLTERAEAEASLKAYADQLQADMTKLVEDLKNQENKLKFLQSGSQEKKDAAATFIQTQANAKVKKEVYEALIDQRRGEMFKKLYDKITDAAKRLAAQNKYSMVIVSDQNVSVPEGPSSEIQRVISMKRFLFVEPAHDVTGELVTLMNNEFKAGVNTSSAPVVPGGSAPAPK